MNLHLYLLQNAMNLFKTSLLFFAFFATSFAFGADDDVIKITHLPPDRFTFTYEIHIPKGIDKPEEQYFYVIVSVKREVTGAHRKTHRIVATCFPILPGKNTFLKIAKTKNGLQELERRDLPKSSQEYSIVKKAILTALKDYKTLKAQAKASKKFVQTSRGSSE